MKMKPINQIYSLKELETSDRRVSHTENRPSEENKTIWEKWFTEIHNRTYMSFNSSYERRDVRVNHNFKIKL